MESQVGIVCSACSSLNGLDAFECVQCKKPIEFAGRSWFGVPEKKLSSALAKKRALRPLSDEEIAELSQERSMEQSPHFVCPECSSPVPSGHKFCGNCGTTVPPEIHEFKEHFFGALQRPGLAKLTLIRGQKDMEGLSLVLQGKEHKVGVKKGEILLPQDSYLSEPHANFYYEDGQCLVKDEGSLNGVYVRIREYSEIFPGDRFVCGEQVFELQNTPKDTSTADVDGTHFFSSPKNPSPFRVTQILEGGAEGMTYCARNPVIEIGRESCDMNFPRDIFMSGVHARIEMDSEGRFTIIDQGAINGIFLRIKQPYALQQGDYLMLGHYVFRAEVN